MIQPNQIRAARALLNMSQTELAERAGVGVATVRRFEGTVGRLRITVDAMHRIQQALEAAGISFLETNTTLGVALRKPGATAR